MVVWCTGDGRKSRQPIGVDASAPLAECESISTLRDPRSWGFAHDVCTQGLLFDARQFRRLSRPLTGHPITASLLHVLAVLAGNPVSSRLESSVRGAVGAVGVYETPRT
jgi:hypothetical protein